MHTAHSTRLPNPCKPVPARRPFASLPHDVAADPRLSPTDVAVLVALTFWARAKDHCWPSDRSIGLRIGRSIPTVQRRLRHLESVGLVERVETTTNRTGRIIRLSWKSAPAPGQVVEPAPLRSVPAGPGSGPVGPPPVAEVHDMPPRSPMIDPPRSSVIDKGRRSVKGEESQRRGTEAVQRQRSEEAPKQAPAERSVPSSAPTAAPTPTSSAGSTASTAPPAPGSGRAQILEWAASDDPILRAEAARRLKPKAPPRPEPQTTAELLARIQENPAHVAAVAEVLARTFDDRRSWNGFHAVARRAFEGGIPPGVLVDALRRASDPKARNPAALFMSIVGRSAHAR